MIPFLKLIFENIYSLKIEGGVQCKSFVSSEGEELEQRSLFFRSDVVEELLM